MSGRRGAAACLAAMTVLAPLSAAAGGRLFVIEGQASAPCSSVTTTTARFAPPEPTSWEVAALGEAERAFARLDLATAEAQLTVPLTAWRRQKMVGADRLRAETLAARLARVRGDAAGQTAAIEALGWLHLWLPPDPARVPPDLRKDIERHRNDRWTAEVARFRLNPLPTRIRIGVDAFPATSPIELPARVGSTDAPPVLEYAPLGWVPWPNAATGGEIRPLAWTPSLAAWARPVPAPGDRWLIDGPDGDPEVRSFEGLVEARGADAVAALLCAATPPTGAAAAARPTPAGIGTSRPPLRPWYRSGWLWSGILAGAAAGAAVWAAREEPAPPAIEVRW